MRTALDHLAEHELAPCLDVIPTGSAVDLYRRTGWREVGRTRAALIREAGVTTAHFVPSMLAAFLAEPAANGVTLARVFCSGEELPAELRERFQRFQSQRRSAEQIADGKFFYRLECHPISVMERITIDSYVDTKFISNALSLAA